MDHRLKKKWLRLLQVADLVPKVTNWMYWVKQNSWPRSNHQLAQYSSCFNTTKFCSFNDIWFRDHIDAPALSILLISQGAEGLPRGQGSVSLSSLPLNLFSSSHLFSPQLLTSWYSSKSLFCLLNIWNIFNVNKVAEGKRQEIKFDCNSSIEVLKS